MAATSNVQLDGRTLTLAQLAQFDREQPHFELAPQARENMLSSVATVAEVIRSKRICYGINTGFSKFFGSVNCISSFSFRGQ